MSKNYNVISTGDLKNFPPRSPLRVDYWGYGLESKPEVLLEIAPDANPGGLHVVGGERQAIAEDIQLVVQGIDQVPRTPLAEGSLSPREILKNGWSDDGRTFETYSIVPAKEAKTAGTFYVITDLAIIEALNEWDMVGDHSIQGWRFPYNVTIGMSDGNGEIDAIDQVINTYAARSESEELPYDRVVDGMKYDPYLLSPSDTAVAITNFLESQSRE